jgi:hypothetical protein
MHARNRYPTVMLNQCMACIHEGSGTPPCLHIVCTISVFPVAVGLVTVMIAQTVFFAWWLWDNSGRCVHYLHSLDYPPGSTQCQA